jgi:hypothetical protein
MAALNERAKAMMTELVTTPLEDIRFKQGYIHAMFDILEGFKGDFE